MAITNSMPLLAVLWQLTTVALREREREREREKEREREIQWEKVCQRCRCASSTNEALTALNTVKLRANISAFGRAL